MEQLLMKTRGIVNKNKQQKHVAFYSVVLVVKNCIYTHTPQNKKPRVFVVYFY
jgi:hypothetical protein